MDNEIFKRGEFSGSLKKKPAPQFTNSLNENGSSDTSHLLSRPLTLSSSTKKVQSGTSSFNSSLPTSSSTSAASKLKKKKSITISTKSTGDKDVKEIKDKDTSPTLSSITPKIPKNKDSDREKLQKITKITRPITSNDKDSNSSKIKSTTNIVSTTTASIPSVKDKVNEIKLKKKRSKSVGSGPTTTTQISDEESETISKLKSSVSNVKKQKSLKRKSIDSGNIFQLDKDIEEAKKEEESFDVSNNNQDNNGNDYNIDDNDIIFDEDNTSTSKKVKTSSTHKKKKVRHSIAGDSLSLKSKYDVDNEEDKEPDNKDINMQDIKPKLIELKKKKKRASTSSSIVSNQNLEPIQVIVQSPPKSAQHVLQPVQRVQFTQPQQPTSSHVNNQYPKTPIPNKVSRKSSSGYKSTSSVSTPYTPSISNTPSNQHFYPQSPGGYELYNYETPSLPMKPLNNQNQNQNDLSYLTPSERDISYYVDEPIITNDVYKNNNNGPNQQKPYQRLITDEEDEFILFKYLLLVLSFIFWIWTVYTLSVFFYHFNDIKYCDTGVMPISDLNGKVDCQWCPDNGLCQGGKFIGCQNDYVVRTGKNYIECILDPSKVQGLVNAINNIDGILRDHKGMFECSSCDSISMDVDQLKVQFLSRYWLNKDQAEQSFNTLIDYIGGGNKNIEELGIDKKLIKTIKSMPMEDGTYQLYSSDESNRPLWCQCYFFIKTLIMNYIHILILAAAGYLGYKYWRYQQHSNNEEILMVEQTFKKITRSLQQRKQTYEEPWVSELILREEILGPRCQEDKKLTRIWEKTMELIYKNHRILVTPKEFAGESVSCLEWIDSNPTPKKVNQFQNNDDSINLDDIEIDQN